MEESILVDKKNIRSKQDAPVVGKGSGGSAEGTGNMHMHSFLLGGFAFEGCNVEVVDQEGPFGISQGQRAVCDEVAVQPVF